MLIGSAGFAAMGAMVKALGQHLDSFQIAFFRCLFGFLVLLPVAIRTGPAIFHTTAPLLHGARAICGVTAMMSGFYALTHLPLATATAITFTKPFFMIILAVLFLGEIVRWRRWSATAVGFIGVLIMLRPGVGDFDPAMLSALLQAFAIACTVVIIKQIPRTDSTLTVIFYFAAFSLLVSIGPAILVWQWPTWDQWLLGAAIGVSGVTFQSLIVEGFRQGEATVLSPLDYSRLVFATLFGYLFFAEVPDMWVYIGAVVVIGSTVYISRREARLGKQPPRTPAVPD